MILTSAALAILVTMALAILRALLGPTIYDRMLAVNMFGTKTVLLIAVIAAIAGRGDYLDIALVYAMINFIAIVAVMKYFEFGSLGHSGDVAGHSNVVQDNVAPDEAVTSPDVKNQEGK